MILFSIVAISIIILVRMLDGRQKSTPFMMYSGKWYYLKLVVIYTIMLIRKLENKMRQYSTRPSQSSGYGSNSKVSPEEMEMKQPLSKHPKAIDAVYFNLASEKGWHLIGGSAHRPHNSVNGFLFLKVPNIGLLVTPKIPDTMMFRTNSDNNEWFGAEGLIFYSFQAMKIWKIQYRGIMHLYNNPVKKFDVRINAVWSSSLPYFNVDTDMSILSVAKSMAGENWNKEFFRNLREFYQTHYEQHGNAYMQVSICETNYKIKLNGVRYRSYAFKRDWRIFHRYALHFITLENGIRATVGVICTPIVFSRLVIGYVYLPNGRMIAVESCTFQLSQHGMTGTPPSDYGFTFHAGGVSYDVLVSAPESSEFFIGWDWESKIIEQFARYTVNGVKGWGAVEWQYRHVKGRPLVQTDNDPSWTKYIDKE